MRAFGRPSGVRALPCLPFAAIRQFWPGPLPSTPQYRWARRRATERMPQPPMRVLSRGPPLRNRSTMPERCNFVPAGEPESATSCPPTAARQRPIHLRLPRRPSARSSSNRYRQYNVRRRALDRGERSRSVDDASQVVVCRSHSVLGPSFAKSTLLRPFRQRIPTHRIPLRGFKIVPYISIPPHPSFAWRNCLISFMPEKIT